MNGKKGNDNFSDRMKLKPRDIILGAVLIAASLAVLLVFRQQRQTDGNVAVIRKNGEVVGAYSLNEDRTIRVEQKDAVNILEIRDGKIRMTEADCPDQYCMKQGAISKSGETIVCLPHRVVVEVTRRNGSGEEVRSGSEDGVDTVAR